MQLMDFLASVPIFKGLSREQYEELIMVTTIQGYGRGQTIFAEGEEGKGFFVVMEGSVKIYKLSVEGKEQILHIFGPGEPFAEAAVFVGAPFPAHALALQKSRVLFIPRAAFIDLISKEPSLALNMLAALSLRLKRFAQMIEELSLKEVPGRLAAHLLYLSEQQHYPETVRLEIGKAQLASLLGTIPETLSRILARLGSQGFISVKGPEITILDKEGLEALALGEMRLTNG
jgi:CRP/FNR family transcriptional regulator